MQEEERGRKGERQRGNYEEKSKDEETTSQLNISLHFVNGELRPHLFVSQINKLFSKHTEEIRRYM